MCKSDKQVSEFTLEGEILEFLVKDGKIKYLKIAAPSEGEFLVKLSKKLRKSIPPVMLGSLVRVAGEKKLKLETGTVKWKAYSLLPLAGNSSVAEAGDSASAPLRERDSEAVRTDFGTEVKAVVPEVKAKSCPNKAKILVCQKSDCQKRGAGGICEALLAILSDRNLEDLVSVQKTGCLKKCKAGPNIVMMPDKTRYSRIDPEEIPELIEKHFASR